MIHDVDESLRALVRRDVLNEAGIEISFDAPTREWSSRRNAPSLNLYLYEIREDLSRRGEQFEEIRDDNGFVTSRRPPARKFKLSYLVTAWTQRAEDEHRLLSAVLSCFLGFDAIPAEVLQGDLAAQSDPVRVTIALPLAPDRSITDVWTALGGELKPSLDLIVTCPFDTGRRMWVGPPVMEEPRIGLEGLAGKGQNGRGDGDGPAATAGKGKDRSAGSRKKRSGKHEDDEAEAEDVVASFVGAFGPSTGGSRAAMDEPTEEGRSDGGGSNPTASETIMGGRGPEGRKFRIQELPRT